MSNTSQIRAKLNSDHPEIRVYEGDSYSIVLGDKREALLDEWVEASIVLSLDNLRNERNSRLAASDWTQNPDAPVDAKAWAKYRQDLRDLPATIEDPLNPVWPSKP